LNGAILIATTFSIAAKRRQNSIGSGMPPTAGCR
jgi:hypothetical protein